MNLSELASEYNTEVSKAVPKRVAAVIDRLDKPFRKKRMARSNEAARLRDIPGDANWRPGMKMGGEGYMPGYKPRHY